MGIVLAAEPDTSEVSTGGWLASGHMMKLSAKVFARSLNEHLSRMHWD